MPHAACPRRAMLRGGGTSLGQLGTHSPPGLPIRLMCRWLWLPPCSAGLCHVSEAADEYVKDLAQLFSPGQREPGSAAALSAVVARGRWGAAPQRRPASGCTPLGCAAQPPHRWRTRRPPPPNQPTNRRRGGAGAQGGCGGRAPEPGPQAVVRGGRQVGCRLELLEQQRLHAARQPAWALPAGPAVQPAPRLPNPACLPASLSSHTATWRMGRARRRSPTLMSWRPPPAQMRTARRTRRRCPWPAARAPPAPPAAAARRRRRRAARRRAAAATATARRQRWRWTRKRRSLTWTARLQT